MKTDNLREVPLSEIIDLPMHSVADTYPLLEKTVDETKKHTLTLPELADSIREHGLQEPIILFNDPDDGVVILDGRNRRLACELAAKTDKIPIDEFMVLVEDFIGTPDEADDFVFVRNDRRDTTASQKAASAAKFMYDPRNARAVERMKARAKLAMVATHNNEAGRAALLKLAEQDGPSETDISSILAKRYHVSRAYVTDALREKRQEIELKKRSKEASELVEEYKLAEAEAKAELEAAKQAEDALKVQEAAVKINTAQNHRIEEAEKAAKLATEAAKKESLLNQVHDGKKSLGEVRAERKQESVEDDPMGQSRSRYNQFISGAIKELKYQAVVGHQGTDVYNFLGAGAQRLCDALAEAFDVVLDFDCFESEEEA